MDVTSSLSAHIRNFNTLWYWQRCQEEEGSPETSYGQMSVHGACTVMGAQTVRESGDSQKVYFLCKFITYFTLS